MLIHICNIIQIIAKYTYIITDRLGLDQLTSICIVVDYKGYLL